jgi:ABC-2 type transport system ATP-binding protein
MAVWGTPAPPAVEVVGLVKQYAKRKDKALDGLTFKVNRGEIFGLLGPNGAGKSTTVGILTTRLQATAGQAKVGGVDVINNPVAARAQFAVVPQHNNLDRALTPRQNLIYHAAYHGVAKAEREKRADTLLDEFGLTKQANAKLDFFSGGMAQRIMIARALIHSPTVLFLDEPGNALDPQSRLLIRDRVLELRQRGVTVVLTTHLMNEAAELVDRVGIVDHGKLLALDTPTNLVRGLAGQSILDLTITPSTDDDPDLILKVLLEMEGVSRGERLKPTSAPRSTRKAGLTRSELSWTGDGRRHLWFGTAASLPPVAPGTPVRLRLYLDIDPAKLLAPALSILSGRSASLNDVHVAEPDLEDVFISLTGRDLR